MKKFNITVNGTSYEVEVEEVKAAPAAARRLLRLRKPGCTGCTGQGCCRCRRW